METQENVGEGATYFHYGRRLQGSAAVEGNSELSFAWDPSYQTLVLHGVTIHRAGASRNALDPARVRILEREKDLEIKMLDGRLSAYVVLEDVRPGDVLEYAYTRTGRNPVFGPRWSGTFWTGSTVPVARKRHRVVLPDGRQPVLRLYAGAPAPVERRSGRARELVWDASNVPATLIDDHLPPEVEVVPRVQLSEWESWADVAAWGAGLFRTQDAGVPAEVVERLKKAGRPQDDAALAALRFVQEDVRYLGVEMGASSHAPARPDEVLRRRFGDCKDKALLLAALLRDLGIEADVALVSLGDRGAVAGLLPSPGAFDHAIVRAVIGKDVFWLDPTLRQRRGSLRDLVHQDAGKALVLSEGTRDLVDVPAVPDRLARRTVRNVFVIPPKGPATLTVTTVATGFGADDLREQWAETRPADIEKSCLEFYTRRYPGIRTAAAPVLKDDAPDGSVTTIERYTIDNLFRGDGREADFYAQEVRDRIVQIAAPGRKFPYALPFPGETIETVDVTFPADWYVPTVAASRGNPWLDFALRTEQKPRGIVLTWSVRYKAASVPAAEIRRFADDVRTILDQLGFELPWGGRPRPRTGLARVNWPVALVAVLLTFVTGFAAFRVLSGARAARVPPLPDDAPYEGLGGWLVLVGFGVLVRPLFLLAAMVKDQAQFFDVVTWESFTAAGQHEALAAVVLAEVGVNLSLLVLSVAVLVAYFRKLRRFVPLFATQLVATPVVLILDNVASTAVLGKSDPTGTAQAAGALLPSMLWIWYLVKSRRVRATFTV
jgi:transglutaminase-like putative cysteine protease